MILALFLLRSGARGGNAKRAPQFAPKSLLDKNLLVIAATAPVKSAQFEQKNFVFVCFFVDAEVRKDLYFSPVGARIDVSILVRVSYASTSSGRPR